MTLIAKKDTCKKLSLIYCQIQIRGEFANLNLKEGLLDGIDRVTGKNPHQNTNEQL